MKVISYIRILLGLFVAGIGIYNIFSDTISSDIVMVGLGLLIAVISIEKKVK